MTNNEIIFETVRNTFTPAQLTELVQATYTAEQIAARRAAVTITVDEGSDESAESIFSAMLAADTFHTFAEWKRMGYSVKKGQHAAFSSCDPKPKTTKRRYTKCLASSCPTRPTPPPRTPWNTSSTAASIASASTLPTAFTKP